MDQKPARSDKNFSHGFIGMPVLVMIVLAVILAASYKSVYDNSHVLGQSTLLAQTPPQTQSAPQPQEQSQPQQQSAPQPQQQPSQPQNQPSQPQQAPQNNQGSQLQPQQNSQPSQQGSQPQQQYQMSPQQQQQYQQYQQMQQQPGNQPGSNQQGSFNQNTQGRPQTGNYNGQQEQQNQQKGQNPKEKGVGNPLPQMSTQDQQKYQQMQQQFQQEAAKYGFSVNGNVPTQYFQQTQQGNSQPQALPSSKDFPTIQGNFNVSSATDKTNVNLNDGNTKIMLYSQNSNLSLNAVKPDGTKVQIDKSAFEKINAAIKLETGSEISQKGNSFTMKRGEIEAQTQFPISFNVATKTFSVQTPSGEQEVKILPDQAVQKLLENKVITQVQTGNASSVNLTELNNQPVYQVQGSNQKKLFGFVPISISKTTYISAQSGNLVTTNQNFVSQILERISF